MRIEAAAHDYQSLGQLGEMRIERDGERDVGQGSGGVYGYLMRVGADLPDQEMCRVLGDGFGVRLTLSQRRSIPGAERCCRCRRLDQSGHRGQRAQFLAPGTQPRDLADQRCHEARLLLRPDQRKHRAERDGYIGAADQLQHPQRVARLVIPPRIAGHDRDPENINVRRLQQCHHRHDVRPARSGGVLIDDDHALLRECGRGRRQGEEYQHKTAGESAALSPGASVAHGLSKKSDRTGLCARISSGVSPMSSCGNTSHLSVSRT